MASTSFISTPRANMPQADRDIDHATSLLIAQLSLDDIHDVSDKRKGKSRYDAPLTDEELAFQLQNEYLESAVRELEDYRIAKSLEVTLETDFPFISAIAVAERAAQEDREAARAVSEGRPLPPVSRYQRMLEDPVFSLNPTPQAPPPAATTAPSPAGRRENPVAFGKPVATKDQLETHVTTPMPHEADNSTMHAEPSTTHVVKQGKLERAQCTSCGELIPLGIPTLCGPCNHTYCRDCIIDLVEACTRDESLFPPRCCNTPFPYTELAKLLTSKLRVIYDTKRTELEVPANYRIYCPSPTCSTFIGSSQTALGSQVVCPKCLSSVCSSCKQPSHIGEGCSENAAILQVRELARGEGWQTCPECHAIIELHQGCYHMTCRCRAQFCYLCAVPWKNCRCPQWEEARLLDTAQRRVEQAMAAQPRIRVERQQVQERVRRMVDNLRESHDCTRHAWRRRDGRARCEECHYTLKDYLLVCRNCSLAACVRCARNRLA